MGKNAALVALKFGEGPCGAFYANPPGRLALACFLDRLWEYAEPSTRPRRLFGFRIVVLFCLFIGDNSREIAVGSLRVRDWVPPRKRSKPALD